MKKLLNISKVKYVDFDEDDLFINVNYKEDYNSLVKINKREA